MPFDFNAVKDFLRCPQSKAELVLEDDALVSTSPEARLKYPVRDGIPILLIDDAEQLPPEQWSAIMEKHGRDAATGQPRGA
ncbi:MAG TPA: Trm112 family protein [Planctomycetaceae bacterium]|nr:Trm112 family protein [Planctomycetaceae bacterium]